ncbi:MAG: hypothetical protein ACLFUB_11040, partial [Cyclobacteriaceae bacterium]
FAQDTSHSRYIDYQDSIPAPPCEYVEIVDEYATKYNILEDFVAAMKRENYFQNDKGIIVMKRYKNNEGDSVWMLNPMIDDGYKDNPPTKFSLFETRPILIYEADQEARITSTPTPNAYNECLEDIIGDRVYLRPTREDRWTKEYEFAGRLYNQGGRTSSTGGGGGIFVIFNDDGSYEIIPQA